MSDQARKALDDYMSGEVPAFAFAPEAADALRAVLDLLDRCATNATGYKDIVPVHALRDVITDALTGGSDE